MHGNIYLDSTVGIGTTFTVNLPLKPVDKTVAPDSPPPMTPQAISARKASVSSRSDITVLLVEDNPTISKITMKTIAKLGFSAKAVWNGQEALDYLAAAAVPDAKNPLPDVVLMDVQMPLLDGYAATEYLRTKEPYTNIERLKGIPVVALTASAIQGDREKCLQVGMDDYLCKPVSPSTLEQTLLRWTVERNSAGSTPMT